MIQKYASIDANTMALVPRRTLAKWAHRHHFSYQPRPGFIYVRSRAISSRTNDNFDTFPAEELRQAWGTFIGKPVFVNHHNEDHTRMRGVIIDAALHDDKAPDGTDDVWIEVLMEVDALRFPKLAAALIKKDIERTSMGTDVVESECSFCGNVARVPEDYCAHVRRMKGQRLRRKNPETGEVEDVLVHEICRGLSFFENSLLVEDPADPTAYTFGLDTSGLAGIIDEDPVDGDIDKALAAAARLARTAAFKVASHGDLIDQYLNSIPSGDAALIRRMGVPKIEDRPVGSGPSFAWYESGTNTICFTMEGVPFDLVAHEMTHALDCAAGWPSETPEYKSLIPKSLKDAYRNISRAGHSVPKEVFVDAYMAAHFPGKQSTHFEAAKSSDPERTSGLLEIARNVASVRTATFKPVASARTASTGYTVVQGVMGGESAFELHVAGCADLARPKYQMSTSHTFQADSVDDALDQVIDEELVDQGYSISDVKVFPCARSGVGPAPRAIDPNSCPATGTAIDNPRRLLYMNCPECGKRLGTGRGTWPKHKPWASKSAARGGPYNPAEESREGFLWRATPGEKVCGGKYEVKRHWDRSRMIWIAFDVDSSGEQYDIGYISIANDGGRRVVDEVKVDGGYRREGLATAMLGIAEREVGPIEHAGMDSLTPDGLQWARTMQGIPVTQDDRPGATWNPLTAAASDEYRGWKITKTDTGGRRMGREVWYVGIADDGRTLSNVTLSGLKKTIDAAEDGMSQWVKDQIERDILGDKTAAVALDENQRARFKGVTVDKDKDGFYVRTHRARSDSYESIEAIPDSAVKFIESTGHRRSAGLDISVSFESADESSRGHYTKDGWVGIPQWTVSVFGNGDDGFDRNIATVYSRATEAEAEALADQLRAKYGSSEPITCHGVCGRCHEFKQLVGNGYMCQECMDSLIKKGWRMATIKTAASDVGLPARGRVPVQVETLRPQTCPVCESDGVWNSDGRCDVCGYLPPPKPFRAPDTDVAGRADQSGGWFDPDLTRATPFKLEGSNPVQSHASARKGQKAPEGASIMTQQNSVAAAARQRIAAQSIVAENQRLRQENAALRRRADAENPAQPVREPAAGAPSQSSDQAMSLPTSTQVTTPGGVIPDPISAPGSVTTPGGEIADPISANQNVEVPVAGTTEPDPAAVIDVQPDASAETLGENAFGGDYLNPQGGTVPDLPGNAATASRSHQIMAGRIAVAVRDRIFASLRLAQLQINAGVAQGDLIEVARQIEASKDSMEVIQARVATLNQLASRPRAAAPTPRIAARPAPSLAAGSLPHIGALQPRDADEALFE